MNNIIFVEIEYMQLFTLKLLENIHETYLGEDVMKEKSEDEKNHFIWALQETCKEFIKIGFNLKPDALAPILYDFFRKEYYQLRPKNPKEYKEFKQITARFFSIDFENIERKLKMKNATYGKGKG